MVLEEQLLPSPRLKDVYEKLVWLYVYRDFSRDERDRGVERVSIRFGVTSWPQLLLVDPRTLEIRAHTGRTVESFLAAVDGAPVEPAPDDAAARRLADAEARARELEQQGGVAAATKGLDAEDIVVRTRALEILAKQKPDVVVERATALLGVRNDPFRYLVCQTLREAGDARAKDALEGLVRNPAGSLNPNVLRIRAVQALAMVGDAGSVEAVAPHAESGVWFNGLTGIAVDALRAIAERHADAREAVVGSLKRAYPVPPEAGDERAMRACVALAKRVHAALAKLGLERPFPEVYDAAAREALAAE